MFYEYNYKLSSFIFKTWQRLQKLELVALQNGTLVQKDNTEYCKYINLQIYSRSPISIFENSLSVSLTTELRDIIKCNPGTELINQNYPNIKIRVTHVMNDMFYIDLGIQDEL